MDSILTALKDTPIPTILVIAGILFLLLSIAGQLAGRIAVPPERQRQAAIMGCLLVLVGVAVHVVPPRLTSPKAQEAPAPIALPPTIKKDEPAQPPKYCQALSPCHQHLSQRRRILTSCQSHRSTRVSPRSNSMRVILAMSHLLNKGPIDNASQR